MMIKHILLVIFLIAFHCSLSAQELTTKTQNVDLDGDGILDKISLNIIYAGEDYSSFLLTVNKAETLDKHSYNVDGYEIIDIDKSDKQKEIAVHTPNANGPDEYIIYRYDGENIKRIGSTHSFTKFNGDGTLDVETYMSFWTKNDRYVYNRDKNELEWIEKKEYDINEEYTVIDDFSILPSIGSANTNGFVKKGEKIRITKAIITDNCDKTGAYSEELCDEFYYVTEDGRGGMATLEDLIGKVDLPLQP